MHPNQESIRASREQHDDGKPSQDHNKDPHVTNAEDGRNSFSPIYHFIFDLERDSTKDPMFPPFTVFILMPFVFWTRYALITHPDGLAIRDPEEHWNTVEIAHYYVFGFAPQNYTFIDGQKDVPKAEMGARGTTSWIITAIYALLFKTFQCFGWKMSSFEMARIFHSLVAASLSFFVYKFSRAMFDQSRDVALLACILVAFSKHLMLSALHPFAEGLLSPCIMFAMALVANLQQGPLQPQSRSFRTTYFWSSFCSCGAGCILGGAIAVHPSSAATIGPILVFLKGPTTPLRHAPLAGSTAWLTAGGLLGIMYGVALDHITSVVLSKQNFSLPSMVQTCPKTDHSTPFTQYFGMLWGGGMLHCSLVLTAFAFSFLNWTLTWNRSSRLTAWIADHQIRRFRATTKLTIMSLASLFLVSCLGCAKLPRIHDSLVLVLVAGASGLHFLYQNVCNHLKSRPKASSLSLELAELVLYCTLALYAWSSWSSLPLDVDNSLQDVLQGGRLASADHNGCLKYVGQQPDVTGIVMDFPVTMTGGWALLGQNVPLISRMDAGWVELDLQAVNRPEEQVLQRRFNYIIVGKNRRVSVRGFYEVHSNKGVRIFRHYDSGYQATFLEHAEELPGNSAAILKEEAKAASLLESEGGLWYYLGDYVKATEMLTRARHLDPHKFESWKILMESYYLLREFDQVEKLLKHCQALPDSECNIPM